MLFICFPSITSYLVSSWLLSHLHLREGREGSAHNWSNINLAEKMLHWTRSVIDKSLLKALQIWVIVLILSFMITNILLFLHFITLLTRASYIYNIIHKCALKHNTNVQLDTNVRWVFFFFKSALKCSELTIFANTIKHQTSLEVWGTAGKTVAHWSTGPECTLLFFGGLLFC